MNFQHHTAWILGKGDNSETRMVRVVFIVCDTLS